MNYEDALAKSPFGLVFAMVNKGSGARVGNRKRKIWKIDRLVNQEIVPVARAEMTITRCDWQPVMEWQAPAGDPVLFDNFEKMLQIAGREAPVDEFPAAKNKPCSLHAGPRGLQTLFTEAKGRVTAMKRCLNEFSEEEMDWSNPELVNFLDEIIMDATALRRML